MGTRGDRDGEVVPELERGPALTESGRHMVQGTLENNPFGRAGLNLLRLMGVGKALKRAMGRSAAQNFNKTSFANSIEVHMSVPRRVGLMSLEFANASPTGWPALLRG